MASGAPAHDTKHPLRQAVEGAIVLDGAELRKIVREDGDRALMTTLTQRKAAPGLPHQTSASQPQAGSEPAQPDEYDYFAEVAQRDLDPVETARW